MLANNTMSPLLRRKHNCILGNEADSLAVWGGRYGLKSARAIAGAKTSVKSRADMWGAINGDETLFEEVLGVLDGRFWFVGILEEMDLSMAVFCALGTHCGAAAGGVRHSRVKPKGGRGLLEFGASGPAHWDVRGEEQARVFTSRTPGVEFDGVEIDAFESELDDDFARGEGGLGQRENHRHGRFLLQKHSSKPQGFKLDGKTRDNVAALNVLDGRLYNLARGRMHLAAAKHAPAEYAKRVGKS